MSRTIFSMFSLFMKSYRWVYLTTFWILCFDMNNGLLLSCGVLGYLRFTLLLISTLGDAGWLTRTRMLGGQWLYFFGL